jgi:hypothetical protein
MAITPAGAMCRHAAPSDAAVASRQIKGEMVMIDAVALAIVLVALSLPAVIMAAMLGSKLKLDW